MKDFILKEDEAHWRSIGRLKEAVVNGYPSFDQIFAKSDFEYLATDPKINFRFEAGMSNLRPRGEIFTISNVCFMTGMTVQVVRF